ncbi:hypothetical protein N658DRAFT_458330, partial [Parathielavia hyrcaniae]
VPWRQQPPNLQQFPTAPLATACDRLTNLDPTSLPAADAPIPNLVHYIWLLADPLVFSLSFKVFVSVYSAHLFLRPDRIYFHTDASPDLWEHASAHRAPASWEVEDHVHGWDGNITLKYVLARQSKYARAVFPVVSHAVEAGVISKEE